MLFVISNRRTLLINLSYIETFNSSKNKVTEPKLLFIFQISKTPEVAISKALEVVMSNVLKTGNALDLFKHCLVQPQI